MMKLAESDSNILRELLNIEHLAIARQIGFISSNNMSIDENLLIRTVGMLDRLSRVNKQRAKKIVVTASAILWTYKDETWKGLRDYLVLILSRAGFPPSAVMIDETYSHETPIFSGLYSLLNEFNITIHQLKYEIYIGSQKFLVTGFQKNVWDKLSKLKLLGISAPTSAGKSFIILLKAIETILNREGNIIYIVPTLSLVAQVSADFNQQLKNFNIKNYRVATTYSSSDLIGYRIYVMTQEKAISAFSQSDQPYQNVRMLVVDEIQNIEKVANENDQRAKTLYDTLMEFRHTCEPDLTIISGPRVEGLKQLGIDIFNQQDADEEKTKDSPVASITYAISKTKKNYLFNQYTDILEQPNRIPISNDSIIADYGLSQYREKFIFYLASFLKNLGANSRNIIFSPTTRQARKTALELSKINDLLDLDEKTISLVSYLKETVHNNYDMCESIPRGFVYHHGKTPTHVRAVIERAVKDKLIPNVVCTTTLMQGVNLPAQNVILRNPDLAIRKREGSKPKLTDYEIANLRGRAGRLLKDFIGRTFVLEEDSFERSDEQIELFPEIEKQLNSGYGEKYNNFKSEIKQGLEKNTTLNDGNKEYAFLMTYIRQTVLKHGDDSSTRLKAVGIDLEEELLSEVLQITSKLEVSKEVCFKNRYWDPIDLEVLYALSNTVYIPKTVAEQNIENSLLDILTFMQNKFPDYYNKYFGLDTNLLFTVCISAKEWMKEKPLKEILNSSYFDSADKVEDRISLLQNKISYGLPMLLKPLYDIKAPDNMFLRFIEIGAYMPITRKMIELNIPRETAIYFNAEFFEQTENQLDDIETLIIKRLRKVKDSIDYWRRIQIDGIV